MKKRVFVFILAGISVMLYAQANWFKAQSDSATIKSVTATSELVEAQYDGKYLYPPVNIVDGDFSSTWCEADQSGPGIGEAITIEPNQIVEIPYTVNYDANNSSEMISIQYVGEEAIANIKLAMFIYRSPVQA